VREVSPEIIRQTLALKLVANDAGESTVRGYLLHLLRKVWLDDEFTSKRPFGNSGWKSYIELPMVMAGLVDGDIDEDGYLNSLDSVRSSEIILACISSLDCPPA
jgi:hypothetical protein